MTLRNNSIYISCQRIYLSTHKEAVCWSIQLGIQIPFLILPPFSRPPPKSLTRDKGLLLAWLPLLTIFIRYSLTKTSLSYTKTPSSLKNLTSMSPLMMSRFSKWSLTKNIWQFLPNKKTLSNHTKLISKEISKSLSKLIRRLVQPWLITLKLLPPNNSWDFPTLKHKRPNSWTLTLLRLSGISKKGKSSVAQATTLLSINQQVKSTSWASSTQPRRKLRAQKRNAKSKGAIWILRPLSLTYHKFFWDSTALKISRWLTLWQIKVCTNQRDWI